MGFNIPSSIFFRKVSFILQESQGRLQVSEALNYANQYFGDKITILANTDISFDRR